LELPAHLELTPAWRQITDDLRRRVGDSTYEIWFRELEVMAWDGAQLVLLAPAGKRTWVAERFGHVLQLAVRGVLGAETRVSFGDAERRPHQPHQSQPHAASAPEPDGPSYFNPRYSFDQFVMGDGNRLAHAAALAVAENPGHAYNPLFLHGPPGLGKTHLLHAIANFLTAFGVGTTVRYTTVEAFTNSFIGALPSRSALDNFKHAYREVDVLLIDDVQFLASKEKTEEEFLHTFNAIYDSGRQLVMTCDRLPAQLLTVEERLRDRFQSGLVASLEPPDHATRVAILRKRVALDRVRLADAAVLDLIAHRITDNIRSLEGVLIRLVAHHSLTGRPIDLPLAREVLDEIHPAGRSSGRTTIDEIQAAVADSFQLSREELISESRAARVTWPRQLAIQLSRDLTGESLQAIGRAFGGRNHATVMHACKRVADRTTQSPEAAADLARIRALLIAA
jgi:chromosomal replication initiator protein